MTTQRAGTAAATVDPDPSTRGAMACLSLSVLLASLGTSIANVALPTLASAFDASFPQLQWVVLAYLLAITTMVVGAGRLGDLIGRRRLLLAGISLFTAASLLSAAAPTFELLIAARALQGLGAAGMLALTMAFVAQTVPRARTGSAMGLLGTMSAIGTTLGPSLGGILIAGFGWRAIFGISVPLGLLAGFLAYRFLPADRRPTEVGPDRFDQVGTLLLALTLGAYAVAMTIGHGDFGPLNLTLFAAALGGLALFLAVENRSASPLIRLAMFRDPVLRTGLVTSALVSTVMMTTLVVGPFHLSLALGLSPATVGLVMSTGPLVAALVSAAAGSAVDRLGATRMVVLGLIAVLAGSLGLAAAPAGWGVPGYLAPLVVLTAGYAVFQAANNTAVMSEVAPDQRGLVAGLVNLSRNLGLITGAAAMGAVFALAAGTSDILTAGPTNVATGTRWTFAVAATLVAGALGVALRRQPSGDITPSPSLPPGPRCRTGRCPVDVRSTTAN